jgi:hypothetical protein
VICDHVGDRQSADILCGHGVITIKPPMFRSDLAGAVDEPPWRIG